MMIRDYKQTAEYQRAVQTRDAKAVLHGALNYGRAAALSVFERVNSQIPRDSVVKSAALKFTPGECTEGARLRLAYGGEDVRIHTHALGQLAAKAGVPGQYLRDANDSGEPWRVELAAKILGEHYTHDGPQDRYLVRAVNGEARGVMSDKYRRLDSRPMLDALAEESQAIGAVPVDGTASDTKIAIKVVMPDVYEPLPGEALAFGLEWHNSDFGHGRHTVRAFMIRLWCLNGATMENTLAQVHLGGRISEDIQLSERTYALDTKASVSALRDVVRGVLGPAKVETQLAAIRQASAQGVDWKRISGSIAKHLNKGEAEQVKAAFEGDDVVQLPMGQTLYRASNAISWLANKVDDPNRALELQRYAGEIMSGRKDAAESLAA